MRSAEFAVTPIEQPFLPDWKGNHILKLPLVYVIQRLFLLAVGRFSKGISATANKQKRKRTLIAERTRWVIKEDLRDLGGSRSSGGVFAPSRVANILSHHRPKRNLTGAESSAGARNQIKKSVALSWRKLNRRTKPNKLKKKENQWLYIASQK